MLVEVKELPADLAALNRLLAEAAMLGPIVERFQREVIEERPAVMTDDRPTTAMETYVRLVLKAEVLDSIHLRRFCRISMSERVPDESKVRRLRDPLRAVSAQGGPDRFDGSRPMEKYPTDASLAALGCGRSREKPAS